MGNNVYLLMCELLVAMVLIALQVAEDEHHVLDIQVDIMVLIALTSLALVWLVTLCCLLVALLRNLLLVGPIVFVKMINRESMILARPIHGLVKLVMIVLVMFLLDATTLFLH
jgi:hypothetical protein